MDLEAANAKYAELHEARPFHSGNFDDWSEKRSASHPYHANDGVRIWVDTTDWNPDDEFLS